MRNIVRWGLMSTARINRALIPGLTSSSRAEIHAVGSRSQEKSEAYAREHGIPHAYGSYDELLADPQVDVVYISLPNHLHAEWTIRACQAGKHVLCEKPLALTVAEVDAIVEAAARNRVHVMEAFMYRFHPQTSKVLEIANSGALGEISYLTGTFTFSLARPDDVRWNPEFGGGSLWDVGCYPISYARMITGERPVEVFGWQVLSDSGVDISFSGTLRFSSGCHAQVHSAFDLPYHTQFMVRGSKATLLVNSPYKPEPAAGLVLRTGNSEETIQFAPEDLYLGEIDQMVDAVLGHSNPALTLAESRDNVATLAALLQSAHSGLPIRL